MTLRKRLIWLWMALRYGSHHLSLYPPGHERYSTRALETHLSMTDVVFGLIILAPAWNTLEPAIYAPMLDLIPSEAYWGSALALRGIAHLVVLRINGAAWWTIYVRALASGLAAFFCAAFFVTILWRSPSAPGLVLTVTMVTALSHFYCLRRSGRDAGIVRAARNR